VNDKKLLFSLEGVDISDDKALAAFTQQVWQQATAAFTQEAETTTETTDNRDQIDVSNPGESHEQHE